MKNSSHPTNYFPHLSIMTKLQKARKALDLRMETVETRNSMAKKKKVHPLVIMNEEESRNICWRTDVSDEAWEAGQDERFNRCLALAFGKKSDDWKKVKKS